MEEQLIGAVKERRELYDKHSIDFRNKMIREKAWEDISKEMGMSTKRCKVRWRSLKDRFTRDYKRKAASSRSSSPGSRKWKFYDDMKFLGEFITPKETWTPKPAKPDLDIEKTVEFIQIPAPSSDAFSIPPSPTDIVSPSSVTSSRRSHPLQQSGDQEKFLEVTVKLIDILAKQIDREEKESGDPFEKFLGSMLKKLDFQQQTSLKMEILNFAYKRINEMLDI
uniref:MADF domain-containing protein n=1 Tax=Glossina pallidipes TaxID=7398 RepID=A0A1A9Z6F2_GLOPL